jgi:hypothetical protein
MSSCTYEKANVVVVTLIISYQNCVCILCGCLFCFVYFKTEHFSLRCELLRILSAIEVSVITDSCLLEIAVLARKERECSTRQMNCKPVYWFLCYFYTISLDVMTVLYMFHNAIRVLKRKITFC